MDVVRQAFRPEFLNRLDEILLFRRLSREDMTGIVEIQLRRLQQLLAERKITLEVDDAAKRWLADAGYDPVYGARPLEAGDPARAAEPAGDGDPGGPYPGRRHGARHRQPARPPDRAAAARDEAEAARPAAQ